MKNTSVLIYLSWIYTDTSPSPCSRVRDVNCKHEFFVYSNSSRSQ